MTTLAQLLAARESAMADLNAINEADRLLRTAGGYDAVVEDAIQAMRVIAARRYRAARDAHIDGVE